MCLCFAIYDHSNYIRLLILMMLMLANSSFVMFASTIVSSLEETDWYIIGLAAFNYDSTHLLLLLKLLK